MKRRITSVLAAIQVLLAVTASVAAVPGQALEIESHEIHQFVAAGKYPPEVIIELDNNREILAACRNGATPADLAESGIDFADSQIELLIAMQLLVRDANGLLITTFPILDPEQAKGLRRETGAIAASLLESLGDDLAEFLRRLTVFGLEQHSYAMMYSYILDGTVWGFFEEFRKVSPRSLSARRPFWAGHVWMMPPRDSFTPNPTWAISSQGMVFKVASSKASSDLVEQLTNERSVLRAALSETGGDGKVETAELREALGRFGLVDDVGIWLVPLIDEVEKGAIFRSAETVSAALVDAILDPERVDLDGLRDRYGLRGEERTLVIVYHELMWDLLDRMERSESVSRPPILDAEQGDPRELPSLAFLIDRRPPRLYRSDEAEQGSEAPETRPETREDTPRDDGPNPKEQLP